MNEPHHFKINLSLISKNTFLQLRNHALRDNFVSTSASASWEKFRVRLGESSQAAQIVAEFARAHSEFRHFSPPII
jgi:hypothetical protein